MNASKFRKQLASISDDLYHGHLSQNESLVKLKELTESVATQSLPGQISDEEIKEKAKEICTTNLNDGNDPEISGLEIYQCIQMAKWAITRTALPREEIFCENCGNVQVNELGDWCNTCLTPC